MLGPDSSGKLVNDIVAFGRPPVRCDAVSIRQFNTLRVETNQAIVFQKYQNPLLTESKFYMAGVS